MSADLCARVCVCVCIDSAAAATVYCSSHWPCYTQSSTIKEDVGIVPSRAKPKKAGKERKRVQYGEIIKMSCLLPLLLLRRSSY